MPELIQRIVDGAGLDATTAQQAVGSIMSFLQQNVPEGAFNGFLQSIPEAKGILEQTSSAASSGSGLMGSLMGAMGSMMGGSGGNIMALFGELSAQGLSMEQMQNIGTEIFAFAKEKMGEEQVAQLLESVPALRNLA